MKVVAQDIEKIKFGFSVPKIKKASDKTLGQIEDELSVISSVSYANIEEYRYLTVGWRKMIMDADDVAKVVDVLNKILNPLTL